MPTPYPAMIAAPSAVASFTTGVTTGFPVTSARICDHKSLTDAPPAKISLSGSFPVASFTSSICPLTNIAVFSKMER